MKRFVYLMFAAGVVMSPARAQAQLDELNSGRVVSVQDRPYRMVHEFTASVGVLPVDAFYTGLSLGGSYTLHFNDLIAWEAISFHYSGNVDSGLESELADRWSVLPDGEPELEYLAGTNAIFTPLIGKFSFFNDSIVHVATFLSLGGGLAKFNDGFRPMGSIGPGIRLFFGDVVSTRLDLRNIIAADAPDGIDYILHVTLSVSFNFGSRDDGDDDDVRDTRTGFEALDELYPLSDPKRIDDKDKEGSP
ncbi:MAG: outer membrane beta-barrel domain-containing protein [Myxococcota bacterium]